MHATIRSSISRSVGIGIAAAALLAACSAAATTAPSASVPATPAPSTSAPVTPAPAATVAPSAFAQPNPTSTPVPSASAGPSGAPLPATPPKSADDAVALVLAQDPRFAGLRPKAMGMIGQGSWYLVSNGITGWSVTVEIGSGDCQAGCINRETWVYSVDPKGVVTLLTHESSGGDTSGMSGGGAGGGATGGGATGGGAIIDPSVIIAIPTTGGPYLVGRVTASPTCPVMRNPPDPACAPRPVAGAVIAVTSTAGAAAVTAVTDADGVYRLSVPAGSYTVTPQPVEGLMETAAPAPASVPDGAGASVRVDFSFDTGIR